MAENEKIVDEKKTSKVLDKTKIQMLGNYKGFVFNECYELDSNDANVLIMLGLAKKIGDK